MTQATASSLRQVIGEATAVLAAAGVTSARVDAELLAAHAAGTERGRLMFTDLPADFHPRFRDLVASRAKRIPVQHLTGTAAFGPVQVSVGPGVFIPRPETEALFEWVERQDLPDEPLIVDLCTGSGALALAIATARPQARVLAVENSAEALDYARRNLADTGVELLDADVTDAGLRRDLDGVVDVVVANPPYLPDGAGLDPEVAEHDPAQALFGGPDGMVVIDAIVALARRWLRPGGRCAVEHDDTTSALTAAAFRRSGAFDAAAFDAAAFDEVTAHTDLTGRPRFVTARRQPATTEG
ncbi:release factor glutamine methyltransferase [Mycolicibacterium doricum]|uniref:Release factor glutamine methyltransferase n=1 Tax=Mycolicibacterium doricum TaxID=126673 RepID=A0A1X1TI45_9MYCO|nr:peptide chain release factor N(5)-glutamine methyltransferase [Mycolicibacterium doricum]MCV7266655.1 peptide chain release factor N(5)-glutamine methyltransferase [Mycolicibacterium doricum]ORV44242.1 protein-(glutamine-N5) methyltransferase, release factor-specific [Mycolicibacterium doricum]BBZ08574.1 release factor glutamine methyltransferase [Mycolicibacterium doricum]